MNAPDPVLEIKDLNVSFLSHDGEPRVVPAVCGLSLDVPRDSFTSLVGQSGSGKSVTALSVCRLIRPYRLSGTVRFYGESASSVDLLSASERDLLEVRGKQIAYVFQDPASSFNPLMTIGEQLDETYRVHYRSTAKEARDRSMDLLEAVRLKECGRVYKSYPHELSGGMKQRAMIAMAIVSGPRLLIADEPTTALDAATESEILRLFTGLRKERSLTILFITHNLALAAEHSDRIHVLQKGRLVESMIRGDGGFRPRETYTQRLFKASFYGIQPKTLIEV